jgi:putative transposase
MRTARIKVAPEAGEAVYHCMTRTVNGERLFDDPAKEILRKQLWQVADFCGVTLVTYAILSNHFHVLLRVPQKAPVPDAELLRRYRILYPKPTPYQSARLAAIEAQLLTGGPDADQWRRCQHALMGDVSQFMKLVKQRFAIWFNRSHHRYGTLWAERFKSVLVEPHRRVAESMAAYIDLNCVRAGLATDPKDYRFCGYAEAVAGNSTAQRGLLSLMGGRDWAEAQAEYRQVLFGTGSGAKEHASSLTTAQLSQVLKAKGRLPLATVLRCRLRHFSDGAVLGTQAFVQEHLAAYRARHARHGRRARTAPRPLPRFADWGDIATLRSLRSRAFG